MQRTALVLLAGLVWTTAGCQKPESQADLQSASLNYDALPPELYATSTATDPTTAAQRYDSVDSGAAAYPPAFAGAGTMHVVAKGDTLFGLARRYYSNAARWRDIYEANRANLSDPNVLKVGQELRIP